MNYIEKGLPLLMKKWLHRLKGRKGQTLVEYALILAFISVIAISVLISLGQHVKSVFTTISSQLAYAQTN
jgi:Flp pilus assembly pilin Flp